MNERDTPSRWRKSTFSQPGDCVEWNRTETVVYVRASKDRNGPMLKFTHAEWEAFIAGVKAGEADLNTNA